MADFSISGADNSAPGNFINPAYATPEQVKQMRDYAEMLRKGSIADTSKSWTGALAQALMGLNGATQGNQADKLQRQLYQQRADALQNTPDPYTQAMTQQLQGGQPPITPQVSPAPALGGSGTGPATAGLPMPPQAPNPADVAAGEQLRPGQLGNIGQIVGIDRGPVTGSFSGSSPSGAGARIAQALMGKPIQMAQNGPHASTNSIAGILANTDIPQAVRDKIMENVAPKAVTSPFGEPGMQKTAEGLVGTQVRGPYQTGYTGNVSTNPEGGGSYSGPIASGAGGTGVGLSGVGKVMGDVAQMGREQGNLSASNSATRNTNKSAIEQAENAYNQYPIAKRTLSQMMDDAKAHGDNIFWGAQNETVQNAKKMFLNIAPSLFSENQVNGIAANDSMKKLSSMLGSMIAKQYSGNIGTDYGAQLTQGQVPGMTNSKQGFLALGNMIDQGLDYHNKMMEAWHALPDDQRLRTNFNQFQSGFYSKPENQIINPITKNRITQDKNELTQANEQQQGGFKHLSNDDLKKLLKLQ